MAKPSMVTVPDRQRPTPAAEPDWAQVVAIVQRSRALDDIEEGRLLPERRILYQFCARGHELSQALLALELDHPRDGIASYYRSRPLMLGLGLDLETALAGPLTRRDSLSGGRDVGVIFNRPGRGAPTVLPGAGGVGTQYTPALGWAQALRYRRDVLGERDCERAIAVALGGDASTATNGFWAALIAATTLRLPMLFYIEDNGYGISVRSHLQSPSGDIAANLAAFGNLAVLSGDGTDPAQARELTRRAVALVRDGNGPALLRLTVPRLSGHSGQDTQSYKSAAVLEAERARDPLPRLQRFLVPEYLPPATWDALASEARAAVAEAVERVLTWPTPDPKTATRFVFSEHGPDGRPEIQVQGGLWPDRHLFPVGRPEPKSEPTRINMVTAIRRTLESELASNPQMVVFGEDVGAKGGVHGATLGLQERFGAGRVFDTGLSEESIIGRAVGMALAGLLPVPEIQFRKYAEPAAEQLNDCGTIRWRTCNRFAAPIIVRMPGGFFKCGDPWHSQTNEVQWLHGVGWRFAIPSNAEDAVGLLRSALRGNDPVIFFEHRALLDGASARRPYPGDEYVLPFGQARLVAKGGRATIVTWGAMLERCERACADTGIAADVIDLRTLCPWDRKSVFESVRRTRRCLIVHEDWLTAGFGAEIAAALAKECFFDLDAPIERIAMATTPSPHSPELLAAVLPDAGRIAAALTELVAA
jgi:2-oxoisovalerate dehydrogenase E1 component